MKNIQLPPDVAEKFELVNWTGGARQVFGHFGTIDLRTLTVGHATELVQRGFSKLKRKAKKARKEQEQD